MRKSKKFYIKKDKLEHAGVSFLITLVIGFLINPLIGFGVAIVVGIGKEIYDNFHPERNDCELMDFVSDIIGALIGLGLIYIILGV